MGGLFDLSEKEKKIQELEQEMHQENFWDNIDYANKINAELVYLKKSITDINGVKLKISDALEVCELLELEMDDELLGNLVTELNIINQELDNLEINILLNKEHDELNCYLEIHPGAGGTESCDWASMLLRMYQRFFDKNNFTYKVIDEQKGEEAGIKSVTILVNGLFAYGYMKCEQGVHRLVRISPFDSGARRHTSFASVSVTPEFDKDINIEINETDLKIDVYRSSGAGGQHVNTTDSAVRITHLPTKTVVTCQNERSQLKNKEQCMKILKSKLYQLELVKQQEEINKIKGNVNINFGSQIRSYVLEPYTRVIDSRSSYETAQAEKVLDGDIIEFIYSILRMSDNE